MTRFFSFWMIKIGQLLLHHGDLWSRTHAPSAYCLHPCVDCLSPNGCLFFHVQSVFLKAR